MRLPSNLRPQGAKTGCAPHAWAAVKASCGRCAGRSVTERGEILGQGQNGRDASRDDRNGDKGSVERRRLTVPFTHVAIIRAVALGACRSKT